MELVIDAAIETFSLSKSEMSPPSHGKKKTCAATGNLVNLPRDVAFVVLLSFFAHLIIVRDQGSSMPTTRRRIRVPHRLQLSSSCGDIDGASW